ncbi:glucose N-acetyltransferase [Paramyrothecium foliicola]|nr:glucose N-acetyltransferase [Paramyrothecium foliicola]
MLALNDFGPLMIAFTMVSRRMRLVIVAVLLIVTIALLTHKQYDPRWVKKVAGGNAQSDDADNAAAKPEPADAKDKDKDESKADESHDADAKATDATTSPGTVAISVTETTAAPSSVVTEAPAEETTSEAEETATSSAVYREFPPKKPDALPHEKVDWNQFAYTQYVTDVHYLCNSVMIFETLYSLGSRPKRVMMYPKHMLKDPKATKARSPEQQLLIAARDKYGAELVPIELEHREDSADEIWADSYTKLLAFTQTQYKRVLALDSDSVVLQIMDELFLLPSAPVAMPRAYWLYDEEPPRHLLSSQLILLEPNKDEFERIMQKTKEAGKEDYDMEVMNTLYLDSAMVLPHRPYNLITSEFRAAHHSRYLGSEKMNWNPVNIFNEAKFLHFSDWPVPKPWIKDEKVQFKMQPDCPEDKKRCPSRDLWHGFYNEFRERRKFCQRVCLGLDV